MTDEKRAFDFSFLEPFRRYVPLAAWAIAILLVLFIPLKVIGYGYLPGDDALRHAAKAVCGKPWREILVLGSAFQFDPNWGWHWLLRRIYLWTHCGTDALVTVEVVSLFLVCGWAGIACLKRPEAWFAAFVLVSLISDLTQRFLLGRPFVLTITAITVILFVWQRHGSSPPKWWTVVWMTPLIAMAVFLHGVWYLWTLMIAAFFLAQQFRWCALLTVSWILGTFLGSSFTGHPIESIWQALELALNALGMNPTPNTLATELRPNGGSIFGIFFVGGLLAMRQLLRVNAPPLHRHPAFWLAALSWVLGCEVGRFWEDWGAPALLVLLASDLQLLFEIRFPTDSFKRLGLVAAVALTTFAVATNDANDRWTNNLGWRFLSQNDPHLRGWLPGKGGIFYSADMSLFFRTFFKNPNADWRYMLGFEPTLMPKADFKIYHNILWNFGTSEAYQPWVKQMRPQDRLVIRGGRAAPPDIPQLEWEYASGIWLGRLPRTNAPPPAPTVPATMPRGSFTNSVDSAISVNEKK